jgi:hypothetical protein
MNITSVTPASTPQATAGAQPTMRRNDGDADDIAPAGASHGHRGGHHGGAIGNDLVKALQSLGIGVPGATTSSTPANGATSAAGADGAATASSDSPRQVIGQFMHALFEAVRSASASPTDAATSTPAPGDRKAQFASGLSALIGEVGTGAAPPALQTAFSALMGALGAASGGSTGSSNDSSSSAGKGAATLQQLLSQLQAQVGYGPAASRSSAGTLVNTTA